MSIIAALKILKSKHALDYLSLVQGYFPFLEDRDIVLFMHLYAQAKTNLIIKSEECDYSKFLNNHQLDYQETELSIAKLAKLNLITVENDMGVRTIKMEKVKPLGELMKDAKFHAELRSRVTEEKYMELLHITGEEMNAIEGKHELNKQTYAAFYSGVLDLLGSEFTMSSEAIKVVKNNEEQVSMEILHRCAYLSVIKTDGKYNISATHFDFLVKQKLSENQSQFNLDDHQEFWRTLRSSSDEEITKNFSKLFNVNDPFNLYKLLTSKDREPDALNKWIKTAVQDGQFPYPIINALMSFVMCLLGKIPVQYLAKVSNTLKNSYSVNKIGLVKLAKNVIDNDIRNGKNRLNVRTEKMTIGREVRSQPKEKINEDMFCCLYSG